MFWKHVILITIGIISFKFINIDNIKQSNFIKLKLYITKYIINYIEPNLIALKLKHEQFVGVSSLATMVLSMCFFFLEIKRKYVEYCKLLHTKLKRIRNIKKRNRRAILCQILKNFVQKFQKLRMFENCNNISVLISKATEMQHNKWLLNVINKETRDNNLYLKWKNVTSIKYCNDCYSSDRKLKTCNKCKQVMYCSKNCQKRDWKLHKSVCF